MPLQRGLMIVYDPATDARAGWPWRRLLRVHRWDGPAVPLKDLDPAWLQLHRPDLQPVAAMGKTGEVRSHPLTGSWRDA